MTCSSEEGIAYFFPAAARYALLPDAWRDRDWYACQLLSHLTYEGRDKSFRQWCSLRQRAAVCALLEHLAATRMPTFEEVGCREELLAALSWWTSGQLDR